MLKFLKNKIAKKKGRGVNQERAPRFKPNSHTHLRSNTKGERRLSGLNKSKIKLPRLRLPNRKIVPVLGIIALSILVGGSILLVIKSDVFLVKNVILEINSDIESERVKESFLGKNIFSIGSGSIEKAVKENFDYVTQVYSRKEYPDTLHIEFVQDKPAYEVYMINSFEFSENFREITDDAETVNRLLTMNKEGIVLQDNEYVPVIVFSDFDIKVLKGEKVLDSEEIRGIYKNKLETEEEREAFDWESVAREEKESIYYELSDKTNQKLVTFYDSFKEYDEFQRFVQYGGRVSKKDFQSDRLGKNKFTVNLMNLLDEAGRAYNIPIWLTPTTLRIDLEDGRRLYFSSGRSFEDQVRDLKVIFDNNIINSGTIFDLRTSNFSVSN